MKASPDRLQMHVGLFFAVPMPVTDEGVQEDGMTTMGCR